MLLQKYQCQVIFLNSKNNFRSSFEAEFRRRHVAILYDGKSHIDAVTKSWILRGKFFDAMFMESTAATVLNTSATAPARSAISMNARSTEKNSTARSAEEPSDHRNVFNCI